MITYMNKLKEWDESKKWKSTEIDENKISKLEINHNISFPESYKEYLTISGAYCPAIIQGHRFEYLEDKQVRAQDLLKEFNLKNLIQKPFWVIADDESTFWYFHLDEGDNPAVHRLDCESYQDWQDEYTFGIVGETFQAWIEKAIENYEKYKQYKE